MRIDFASRRVSIAVAVALLAAVYLIWGRYSGSGLPAGIASGNSLLVGNERSDIVAQVRRLLDDPSAYRAMAVPALPFGDGKSAPRIAELCGQWLARQRRPDHALIA